ncbi:MAG: protein translocase subunit SecD [Magnetococcales bacterium]|nr:protein translocase subunit SecD [Magnetococcales bacterium]MBF0113626.1 protein translocase subunit SecD [Magnetococcales bacterium]
MRQVPLWKPALILFTVLLSLLYVFPSVNHGVPAWWPSWLPHQVIAQGLDLQGGLHLLLNVESDKAVEQTAENLVDEVRGILRKEQLRYQSVEREGIDTVSIVLTESGDSPKYRQVLEKELPTTQFGEDAGSKKLRLTIKPLEQKEIRRFALEQSIQTIRSRIDQFGVTEPTIQKQGEDRILVQLPGLNDPTRAKALIGRTARLEFKMVDEKGDLNAALAGRVPPGDVILYGNKESGQKGRQAYLLKKRTVLSGDLLTDARVNFSQYSEAYVSITFNRQGERKFAQLTGEHVNERMAIVLDNVVYSAPVIREKIEGGRAQISGSFSTEEAHDLAIILRAGALPAPVKIVEERTVGPTLGQDSIDQGLASILIGGALVLFFMGVYYKGFGWLANMAVLLNVLMLMAALAMMQATLTMPGIAGAVLLMGMSVDANVLIFERIREELRLGKTPLAAIEHGYARAFATILDSHITTLITGLVLYQFGTGPVRGFAVTLSIGLIISMYTAVFVTRVVLDMILQGRHVRTLSV